jgi:hypothetical protein
MKTFYSRIPGSRFIFPHNDKEINFVGGAYEAKTQQEEDELQKVVESAGSIIFTRETINQIEKETLRPNLPPTDAEVDASVRAMHQVGQVKESGDTNTGKEVPDPVVSKSFSNAPEPEFDAAKAEQLRKAALARQAIQPK